MDMDYTLYFVTDEDLLNGKALTLAISEAILGGATLIQLREKKSSSRDFYQTALEVKKITDYYNVPLIINDRLDIALATNASGVHLGQSDLPADIARTILGKDKIIGVSARTALLANKAVLDGADYIGVGAMATTSTKPDAKVISRDELIKIRETVSIPIVIIGGLNKETLQLFSHTNVNGAAIVSAIASAPDITLATKELKKYCELLKS